MRHQINIPAGKNFRTKCMRKKRSKCDKNVYIVDPLLDVLVLYVSAAIPYSLAFKADFLLEEHNILYTFDLASITAMVFG